MGGAGGASAPSKTSYTWGCASVGQVHLPVENCTHVGVRLRDFKMSFVLSPVKSTSPKEMGNEAVALDTNALI